VVDRDNYHGFWPSSIRWRLPVWIRRHCPAHSQYLLGLGTSRPARTVSAIDIDARMVELEGQADSPMTTDPGAARRRRILPYRA